VAGQQPVLEIEIEELLGRRGTTFTFRHDGHKCFCFITAAQENAPRLNPGMRVVAEGRWSEAVPHVFEARSVIALALPD